MSFEGVHPGILAAEPGMKMVPQEERQKRIAAWVETTLPGALRRLEKLSQEGCMVGSQLSWADICVFNRLNQLLDIDEGVLHADFPKLQAVYERVDALPQVQAWIDVRGQHQATSQSFHQEAGLLCPRYRSQIQRDRFTAAIPEANMAAQSPSRSDKCPPLKWTSVFPRLTTVVPIGAALAKAGIATGLRPRSRRAVWQGSQPST